MVAFPQAESSSSTIPVASTTSTPSPSNTPKGPSGTVIAAGVVVGVVALFILMGGAYLWWRTGQRRKGTNPRASSVPSSSFSRRLVDPRDPAHRITPYGQNAAGEFGPTFAGSRTPDSRRTAHRRSDGSWFFSNPSDPFAPNGVSEIDLTPPSPSTSTVSFFDTHSIAHSTYKKPLDKGDIERYLQEGPPSTVPPPPAYDASPGYVPHGSDSTRLIVPPSTPPFLLKISSSRPKTQTYLTISTLSRPTFARLKAKEARSGQPTKSGMSKGQIDAWRASASTSNAASDDEGSGGDGEQRHVSRAKTTSFGLDLDDWIASLGRAQKVLLGSSTNARIGLLVDGLAPFVKDNDLNLQQSIHVFKLLTTTYPRYADGPSRAAVEDVLSVLVRRDELRGAPEGAPNETKLGVLDQVVAWLGNEASQRCKKGSASSQAPADIFILLSWSSLLYTLALECTPDYPSSSRAWPVLLGAMSLLLDAIQDDSTPAKHSLRKGALTRVRRALRSAPGALEETMEALLAHAAKGASSSPGVVAPLLGTTVDVLVRLKDVPPEKKELSASVKKDILQYYTSSILMSKTAVSSHTSAALRDFVEYFVAPADFLEIVLPAMEKALLRSPENCLTTISNFFAAYSHPLDETAFRRILTPTLSSAKSSNAVIRANAVSLFKTIMSRQSADNNSSGNDVIALDEVLALPKAGKTASVDHRVALYSMVAFLRPSDGVSPKVVASVPPLLAKETHDAAMAALSPTASPHVAYLLRSNQALSKEVATTLAREMNSAKPPVRRAFCALVGDAFWELGTTHTEASTDLATALLPAFEANLKNVTANPLNSVAGSLEGYVALAVLLGSLTGSGSSGNNSKFDDFIAKHAIAQALLVTGAKPSFLLWEKVYQKLTTDEEEKWLLRASEAVVLTFHTALVKNEAARESLGLLFLHLSVESKRADTRRSALSALGSLTSKQPALMSSIVREGLVKFISIDKGASTKARPATDDAAPPPANKQPLLASVLSASSLLDETLDNSVREAIIVDMVILGHHPAVCGNSRQVWIEACQRAHLDPMTVVEKYLDALLRRILVASDSTSQSPETVEASHRAVTSLTFVAPSITIPRIMQQLQADLDANKLTSLGPDDLSIWETPEGTAFVDVLAAKKPVAVETKGKNRDIAKWEAEVRKSIASKKTGPITLSKQDQALVDAQLQKEAEIRKAVSNLRATLLRGLAFVRSLVAANVEELHAHVTALSSLLLEGPLPHGARLLETEALDTYLRLSECCSERLGVFRKLIGVAAARSLGIGAVPEELRAEPLGSLVIRILYQLRSESEKSNLDTATFSYTSPLLSQVISSGGLDLKEDDDPMEQVTLALDVIKFHCGEFSDVAFPRSAVIKDLLHFLRHQPKLVKDASSALTEIGEAIHANVSKEHTMILIKGTLAQESHVRNACLQALQTFDLTDFDWSPELWLVCHDDDEPNAQLARFIWEDNGLDIPETFFPDLRLFLDHGNMFVRNTCAAAIAEGSEHWPQQVGQIVLALGEYYREKAKILAPEFDRYGMVIADTLDQADPWPGRVAVAKAFEALAPHFSEDIVEPFFKFLIDDQALGDRESQVRRGMLDAGVAVIDVHGQSHLVTLISTFEAHLGSSASNSETSDYVKEAVVVLFGRVARHLEASDPRVPQVVDRLVEALKYPSEQVQVAVSDCLPPLVKSMQSGVDNLMIHLFTLLFDAPKYGHRRGAAYGIAGVIKGAGLSALKRFNIVGKLRDAVADKKRLEPREGAMMVLETLSATLGRLFEPYIVYILPFLLTSFGDATQEVREAAQVAAKVIMANLSAYGVKLMMPLLLAGLEEKQWRTKKGSIELLGSMAWCSPKQLSISLPTVVPQLTGVLTDSHAQVRGAAKDSLKQFGEVINNPEIQTLVPTLLRAFVDPAKVPAALNVLLKTSFMHYIDSASLALVIPILERGLKERGADTKRRSVQIVGNLASVTESKDFVPYLHDLLPMIHVVLADPVPEARATAAKALGTLVERLGEGHFPDLVPNLIRTLKTDTSGVDRQGAAQGLSEVLSGLGMERMEGLLPDIIANAQSPRSTVREGFMSLLVFLPATFGTRFQPHLPRIITPILSGLADSEEYVREAAMRAGRMIVNNYSHKAIDLLLPELERGMFDVSWRIRHSSITLVGELLFKVSGISGKSEIEEDEAEETVAVATESSRRALTEALGAERRDRILSALYLVRQDAVNLVRQASIHIWKALVHNTPRTVREILGELIGQIVSLLTSSGSDQQETAARTMGELCRKFGERIIGSIVPLLRARLASPDPRTREGVCLALGEVMENATDTQRDGQEDEIITMVRKSLVDDEAGVRSAAAKAFDSLQEHIGAKAIDQTIPTLLEALRQPGESSGTALQALREVMSVRASTVFPVLIPTLIATPITAFNARALASLVTVAGNALSKRLTVILGALVKSVETETDGELREDLDEAIRALLESVGDAEGLNTLMLLLLGWAKNDDAERRASACRLFGIFCQENEIDSSIYRLDWIRQLTSLLDDREVPVHTAASTALDAFVKSVPKDELEPLVVPLRRTLEDTGAPGRFVPGLSLSKGVAPLVPVIIAGLTTGSHEQREMAALAIADLVQRTEQTAMKPYVVPFTGPLIRVATQATTSPPAVKTGILTALTTMLDLIPTFVKPFFPQLQRTFIKAAADPASLAVRLKAGQALGALMRSQPRVDPVATELITGARNGEDDAISASLVTALAYVVHSGDSNMTEKARDSCVELISDAFGESHNEPYMQAIASLFAVLSKHVDLLKPIIESNLLAGTLPSILSSHAVLAVLQPPIGEANHTDPGDNVFQKMGVVSSIAKKMGESIGADKPAISRPAREARDLLKALEN